MTDKKLLAIYFLLALLLFPFYRYYIDSDDFLVYLTLSEKYASGNYADAINSYWGPMISWIAALFIKTGFEPLVSFKIIQVLIGGIAYFLSCRLFSTQSTIFVITKIFIIPLILSFAYLSGTPDLLMLVWYLLFIFCLEKKNYPDSKYSFVLLGVIGGLMYFTKGFGFYYFLIGFSLYNIYLFTCNNYSKMLLLKKYVFSMLIFFSLSSLWIIPISKIENAFTISTSGKYNLSLVSPAESPDLINHMSQRTLKGILLPLPNQTALSAWEQPSKLMNSFWNPFASSEDFYDYLRSVFINLKSVQHFHFGVDLGALLLVLLCYFFFKERQSFFLFIKKNSSLFFLPALCTILYVSVLAVHRYLWINDIVIAILFTGVVNELKFSKLVTAIILSVSSFLLILNPVKDFAKYFNGDKQLAEASTHLSKNGILSGNIASIDTILSEKNYTRSSIVAYYTKSKYYGLMTYDNFLNSGIYDMKGYGIKHLLIWSENDLFDPEKYGMKKTYIPEINLSVYSLGSDTK